MVVFHLIDDLLTILGYVLGLICMILFEYKVIPHIGNVPNEKNIFFNRFKFAKFIVLLRLLYLIVAFLKKYIF